MYITNIYSTSFCSNSNMCSVNIHVYYKYLFTSFCLILKIVYIEYIRGCEYSLCSRVEYSVCIYIYSIYIIAERNVALP